MGKANLRNKLRGNPKRLDFGSLALMPHRSVKIWRGEQSANVLSCSFPRLLAGSHTKKPEVSQRQPSTLGNKW